MSGKSSSSAADAPDPATPAPRFRQRIGFWVGLVLFFFVQIFLDLDADRPEVTRAAGIASLMAVWWMTEALPLAVTALIPIVLFPISGIMPAREVAPSYIDSNIILFAGGFVLALAMQRWNLHRRIALIILLIIGGRPHRIVLGFMTATAVLSMWVSNTATTMMMLPMALSLCTLFESAAEAQTDEGKALNPRLENFPLVLMLGIAYAASIGGIGTIIGTPPNVVLVTIFQNEFPEASPISFAEWFMFAAPLSVIFVITTWFLLTRWIYPLPSAAPFSGHRYIRDELRGLGPLTREEATVAGVFTVTALLWIFRKDIELGSNFTLPGWSGRIPHGNKLDDGSVAMFAALLLFILPASARRGGGGIMDWKTAKGLPWDILILFGGGFALARGFTVSGLSNWIGGQFEFLQGAPVWVVIGAVATTMNFVTELTSNTATTQMILPILSSLARTLEINPLLLMIPAALSASCAFMLPVATPPNAIVFGSGRVPIGKMIRAGFMLNLIGIVLATGFVLTVGLVVFQISPSEFPDWALSP